MNDEPTIPPVHDPDRVVAERCLATAASLIDMHLKFLVLQLANDFPDIWEQTVLGENAAKYDRSGSNEMISGIVQARKEIKEWLDFLEIRPPKRRKK